MFSSSSTSKQATVAADLSEECVGRLFKRVDDVLAAGQRIAYVSLGTPLTSTQDKKNRWERCAEESSISCKELWQAVFRAVFALLEDEILFYKSSQPLIVVSTGPQPDALSGLTVLTNAICLPSVPQVRLLKKLHARSDTSLAAVITRGDQNSLMEALSVGAPIIVCLEFGD